MPVWDPTKVVVDIQPGGPGNPWKIFGINGQDLHISLGASKGGGRKISDRFARDVNSGQLKRIARLPDGDPDPFTFDLSKRVVYADWTELLKRFLCEHSVRARQGCGNYTDRTNYTWATLYDWVFSEDLPEDGDPGSSTTDKAADVMQKFSENAAEKLRQRKVNHLDVSGSVSDFLLNKVRSIGYFQCQGDCGTGTDGNESFIAFSNADNTPGYLSNAKPRWYITLDGAATWGYSGYVDIAGNAPALDGIKLGAYVIVAINGAGGGIAYARYQDLIDGVSPAWAFGSGVTNSSGSPRALSAADGQTLYAVGDGGYIHKSTTGGLSWTVLSAGTIVTSQLNTVEFADATLGWIGGNSAVLIKYDNGVLSRITLPSGVTGNILAVRVPDATRRGYEVYFSTSTGQMWRSRDKGKTWEQLVFDGANSGSVPDFDFADPGGQIMYVIQTNTATKSRILRDLSGGNMANDVELVGSYLSPGNGSFSSIAVADINTAVVVGAVQGGFSYIGKVS
jgi:hypothetical protein